MFNIEFRWGLFAEKSASNKTQAPDEKMGICGPIFRASNQKVEENHFSWGFQPCQQSIIDIINDTQVNRY